MTARLAGQALWRVAIDGEVRLARGAVDEGPREILPSLGDVDVLLSGGAASLQSALGEGADGDVPAHAHILVPIAGQEVWASGVTYERSRQARNEEAGSPDYYDKVYTAHRPELFAKAAVGRSRGPNETVGIRSDSSWDVPEPELGLVVDSRGDIVGYVVGNDVSSRTIEAENPLYLPQAKVYRGSCAVGPCIVPVAAAPPLAELQIFLRIKREGREVFADNAPVSRMRRHPEELADWLFRGMDFPVGVVLLTGTAIVPPPEFTLLAGDEVDVAIPGVGTLTNRVEVVQTRVGTSTESHREPAGERA
jgi:2-dehydro-3-deoxy-D-arabinonate dehydratase